MTNILVMFWKFLICFGLAWYVVTIGIVGIKGFKNIRTMLGGINATEEK